MTQQTDDKTRVELEHLRAETRLFSHQARRLSAPLWRRPEVWGVAATLLTALAGYIATTESEATKELNRLRTERLELERKAASEILVELNRSTKRINELVKESLLSPATCDFIERRIPEGDCALFQQRYQAAFGFVVGRAMSRRNEEVEKLVRRIRIETLPSGPSDHASSTAPSR